MLRMLCGRDVRAPGIKLPLIPTMSIRMVHNLLSFVILVGLARRHDRRSVSPQDSGFHAPIAQFVQRGRHFNVLGRTSQI
jgi:hypothetical protein